VLTSLQSGKKQRKNLCWLLQIDITLVINANENNHTGRQYTVVFSSADEIYDDMPLFN